MKHLKWDQREFHAFKTRYKTAVKHNCTSFIFKNDEFLTAYAKYLIEYLEPRFKEKDNKWNENL